MSYKESDIVYENGGHWVLRVKNGFEVYKNGITPSTRCAIIGWSGAVGEEKAIAECDRRCCREQY
jgi:hypothetical protein